MIGALLGGLLAVAIGWYVLRRTLENERALAVEAREDARFALQETLALERDLAEQGRRDMLIQALTEDALSLQARAMTLGVTSPLMISQTWVAELQAAVLNIVYRSESSSPRFSATMRRWVDVWLDDVLPDDVVNVDEDGMRGHLLQLAARVGRWLRDPSGFEEAAPKPWNAEKTSVMGEQPE